MIPKAQSLWCKFCGDFSSSQVCIRCYQSPVYPEFAKEKRAKNQAYTERNKLVALLASLYPSSLEKDPEEDLDWQWVVFIELPTGQVSWHIHDSELRLFDHVERFKDIKWDGHTTEEKYDRLRGLY
jgi:hypothetical protein